jgi:hypothetical protein
VLDQLPTHVLQALYAYRTCEFSTLAKDGTPLSTPVSPVILPDQDRIVITTSIALPNKAFNVRRNGRVAILFSDPTASGLDHPPSILVQGDATVSKTVETWTPELEQLWKILYVRQPSSAMYSTNALTKALFDWYYMRLLISITPRQIRWWDAGDMTAMTQTLEASYVG